MASKRNPAEEAKARYILGSLLFNAQLWASMTRSTDDDRVIKFLTRAVQEDDRWREIAEAIYGE